MKVTIEIKGMINENNIDELHKDVQNVLKKYFKSFKFGWQILRGLEVDK